MDVRRQQAAWQRWTANWAAKQPQHCKPAPQKAMPVKPQQPGNQRMQASVASVVAKPPPPVQQQPTL
eukprot:3082552-Lingulodinium_polyedra.AAC.1